MRVFLLLNGMVAAEFLYKLEGTLTQLYSTAQSKIWASCLCA